MEKIFRDPTLQEEFPSFVFLFTTHFKTWGEKIFKTIREVFVLQEQRQTLHTLSPVRLWGRAGAWCRRRTRAGFGEGAAGACGSEPSAHVITGINSSIIIH